MDYMNNGFIQYALESLIALLPTLIFVAGFVALWLLVVLILRPFRIWYWKVDKQGKELENINRQLFELRMDIKEKRSEKQADVQDARTPVTEAPVNVAITVTAAPAQVAQAATPPTVTVTPTAAPATQAGPVVSVSTEGAAEEVGEEHIIETAENVMPLKEETPATVYNTDKKGRTYTEEEIEKLIRD